MRIVTKLFFYTVVLLIVTACSSQIEKEQSKISTLESSEGWSLKITDTIQLKVPTISPHLSSFDSLHQRHIMYDAGLKTFYEFNGDWTLRNEISLAEDSPNGYGPQCYGFTLYQDTLVAVSGLNGIYLYNKNWDLLKKYKRPDGTFPDLLANWQLYDIRYDETSKLISKYRNEQEGDDTIHKPFGILDLSPDENFQVSFFGSLHPGSIFLDENWESPKNKPQLAYNEKWNHIYRVNSLEPIIYVYSKEGQLLKLLNIRQEHFKNPVSVNPGLKGMERIKAEKVNDRFVSLNSIEDQIVAFYFKGSEGAVGNSTPRRYISVVRDEKLMLNSIEVESPMTSLLKLYPNGKMLFKGNPPSTIDGGEGEGTWLYMAELTKK